MFYAAWVGDPAPPADPVTRSLRNGKYPWYDPGTDRVRPVWPLRISWLTWLGQKIQSVFDAIGKFLDRFKWAQTGRTSMPGDAIGTLLLLTALLAFFFWIVMLWVRRQAGVGRHEVSKERPATSARLGDLPEGIRPGDGDPWAEAKRRRAAGDLSGAVICLFAHQLLALDQLGLIRLAPGKTGRHYVQGLRDRELADSLGATLKPV